eukprot:Nitzschia sp. Nitz4//scaffold141_size107518//104889//105845//NITZ4_004302-RA/size107518-augustus-gene-0.85-mRNA-1//1//CDS//3329536366//5640//frame0
MGKSYTDTYFQKDESILAVYDVDYDKSTDFNFQLGSRNAIGVAAMIPYCWPCLPFIACFVCMPIFYDNVRDAVEAQHVAITQDGIKYVVERHKRGCRLDCQDVGKVSKTVPFDKITDCDVAEPAGASGPCCCMVQNVLYTVNVDTASGNRGGEGSPKFELVLAGLKDPDQFKNDVWSMKRGEGVMDSPYATGAVPVAPSAMRMEDRVAESMMTSASSIKGPAVASSVGGDTRVIALLEEQNKLLKSQNKILKDILHKDKN